MDGCQHKKMSHFADRHYIKMSQFRQHPRERGRLSGRCAAEVGLQPYQSLAREIQRVAGTGLGHFHDLGVHVEAGGTAEGGARGYRLEAGNRAAEEPDRLLEAGGQMAVEMRQSSGTMSRSSGSAMILGRLLLIPTKPWGRI